MVAIDIEFEIEEEERKAPKPSKQEGQTEEICLEFSASSELVDLASEKSKKLNEEIRPSIDILDEVKIEELKPAPKIEISEEMKAIVNKVKAEAAKVRSLDEVRQKKPPQTATRTPPTKIAAPITDIFNENKNMSVFEKLDPMTKLEVEAEIRIAKAEARGETSAFYLSEAKLLEYQIIALLKYLSPKNQEELKIFQQIQKRLSDHTKKKPS